MLDRYIYLKVCISKMEREGKISVVKLINEIMGEGEWMEIDPTGSQCFPCFFSLAYKAKDQTVQLNFRVMNQDLINALCRLVRTG